jgi:hypothetical protein
MPDKTYEEIAEEIQKEAYFDLTIHPSEAGAKGSALLTEYIKAVESRLVQALHAADRAGAERELARCLNAVENVVEDIHGAVSAIEASRNEAKK